MSCPSNRDLDETVVRNAIASVMLGVLLGLVFVLALISVFR